MIADIIAIQEADVTIDPNIEFGLVQGHGVIRGQLMECEPPAIISGYDSRTLVSHVDILIDTYSDIGTLNMSFFSIAIVLCTVLLYLGRHSTPIMTTLTYLLQKISIKIRNYTTIPIIMSLSVILFYFLLIFTSLLHVNLVKVETPVVINDYDDIIDRLQKALNGGAKFNVAWSAEYPDTELFSQASDDTKEAKIWDASLKNKGPFFVKLRENIAAVNNAVIDQSMVVILNKGYIYFVRNILCDANELLGHFHSWISVDNDAKWNQKGYIIRESLSGPLRSWVDKRTQRMLEAGVLMKLYRESKEMRFPAFKKTKRSNCSSEVIMVNNVHENAENTQLGNGTLKASYLTCAVLHLLAFIALIIENFSPPNRSIVVRHRRRGRKVRYRDIIVV